MTTLEIIGLIGIIENLAAVLIVWALWRGRHEIISNDEPDYNKRSKRFKI